MLKKKNIAILISGNGSHINNFFQFIEKKKLNAQITLIISSKKNVLGLKIANQLKIANHVVEFKYYKNNLDHYSKKITEFLIQYKIDIVLMAGFLSPYYVPKLYEYKILNIHPSLIPSFSGKGFFGNYIYKKILEAGVKITGITIHFVNNGYDQGPIIFQKAIQIKYKETLENLKKKINKLEKKTYPLILKAFLENKIKIHKNYIQILKK